MILAVISIIWLHKHTEHVYIWIFLWIVYEYCHVIYQSFGCIDMLNLCIYESFELLIVNVGYEYERVLWTWVWYECLPFLLYLCVNLLVCLLWGIKRGSLIKVMLCPIYVFPSNHIIYTSKRARALQREKNMAHTYVLFFFTWSVITCAPV